MSLNWIGWANDSNDSLLNTLLSRKKISTTNAQTDNLFGITNTDKWRKKWNVHAVIISTLLERHSANQIDWFVYLKSSLK